MIICDALWCHNPTQGDEGNSEGRSAHSTSSLALWGWQVGGNTNMPFMFSVCEKYNVMYVAMVWQVVHVLCIHLLAMVMCSVIGTPFYVMRYVPGQVLKNPALPGLRPSQRRVSLYCTIYPTCTVWCFHMRCIFTLIHVCVRMSFIWPFSWCQKMVCNRQLLSWLKIVSNWRLLHVLPSALRVVWPAPILHDSRKLDGLCSSTAFHISCYFST